MRGDNFVAVVVVVVVIVVIFGEFAVVVVVVVVILSFAGVFCTSTLICQSFFSFTGFLRLFLRITILNLWGTFLEKSVKILQFFPDRIKNAIFRNEIKNDSDWGLSYMIHKIKSVNE